MSLDCDGVDDQSDHGDINAIDSAANMTWMFWIYRDAIGANDGMMGKGTAWWLYSDSGAEEGFKVGQTAVWERRSATGTFPAGSWQHWAVTYDGSLPAADRIVMYKNGAAVSTVGSDPGATLADGGASGVLVGNASTFGFIDAKFALVKLWNATLTAAEIAQEYTSYRPARTSNLLLWSPYDDGTSARDYSGSGNHGTVTGALQAQGPPVSYGGI